MNIPTVSILNKLHHITELFAASSNSHNHNEALSTVTPYPAITKHGMRAQVWWLLSWVWPFLRRLPPAWTSGHHQCEMLVLFLMLLYAIMVGGDEWRGLLLVLFHGVMADITYVLAVERWDVGNKRILLKPTVVTMGCCVVDEILCSIRDVGRICQHESSFDIDMFRFLVFRFYSFWLYIYIKYTNHLKQKWCLILIINVSRLIIPFHRYCPTYTCYFFSKFFCPFLVFIF